MSRLDGKVAVVCGAGQTPGATIGNGRATATLFAREGAKVLCVDRDIERAKDTEAAIREEAGEATALGADVTDAQDCRAIVDACMELYGRLDVLHNNVGIAAGDASVGRIELADWHRIFEVNLTGMMLTVKAALPVMRDQGSGVITNVSSVASIAAYPMVAYKVSKAGVNALTQQVASANARYGIRCNVILPGLMNTPMAIEGISAARGISTDELIRERDEMVPLKGGMGSAWDIAHAALFLASEEAGFITGVVLPVDGGQSIRVG